MKAVPSRWAVRGAGILGAAASLLLGTAAATITPAAVPGLGVVPSITTTSAQDDLADQCRDHHAGRPASPRT